MVPTEFAITCFPPRVRSLVPFCNWNHTIASRWTATVQWCLWGGGCWPTPPYLSRLFDAICRHLISDVFPNYNSIHMFPQFWAEVRELPYAGLPVPLMHQHLMLILILISNTNHILFSVPCIGSLKSWCVPSRTSRIIKS